MSEKFVASNGVEVGRRFDNQLEVRGNGGTPGYYLYRAHEEALREFFLHERDTELGRWRDPAHPAYVVYPKANSTTGERMVRVVSEVSGYSCDIYEGGRELHEHQRAASAYFKAHPEPKPWHSPEVGDFWALHIAHGMALSDDMCLYKFVPWMGGRPRYVPQSSGSVLDAMDPSITRARRIWPEVVSDDS